MTRIGKASNGLLWIRKTTGSVWRRLLTLRRALEPGRSKGESGGLLVSSGGGYLLLMERENMDVQMFLRRHAEACRLSTDANPRNAIDSFDLALRLWRGDAYADVPGPFVVSEPHQGVRQLLRDELGIEPGLVGKTALALHLAHQLSGRFPDGELFADRCGFNPHRERLAQGRQGGPVAGEGALSRLLPLNAGRF